MIQAFSAAAAGMIALPAAAHAARASDETVKRLYD